MEAENPNRKVTLSAATPNLFLLNLGINLLFYFQLDGTCFAVAWEFCGQESTRGQDRDGNVNLQGFKVREV